jgi:hypothetical protein
VHEEITDFDDTRIADYRALTDVGLPDGAPAGLHREGSCAAAALRRVPPRSVLVDASGSTSSPI